MNDNRYKVYFLGNGRIIQEPKPEHKKKIQEEVMPYMNQEYFPLHEAAYGSIEGKNTIQCALLHDGAEYILNMDIRKFYPSVNYSHIIKNIDEDKRHLMDYLLRLALIYKSENDNCLPTGAQSSPYLANLAVKDIDLKLSILAEEESVTLNSKVVYTRYLDDITFSIHGPFRRWTLKDDIKKIVEESGFRINHKKTKWMTSGSDNMNILGISNLKNLGVKIPRKFKLELKDELFFMAKNGEELNDVVNGKLAYVKFIEPSLYNKLISRYRKHFERTI